MKEDYYKVIDVINSCKTIKQLEGATKMLGFWLDKHLDYQMYSSTFDMYVKTKFSELNGDDISTLPYKTFKLN
jgi:hypothetical protein